MNNTTHHKETDMGNMSQSANLIKNARIRLRTSKQIADAIHSQPLKDEKNSNLFNMWIENLIDRAHPLDWNEQAKRETSEIDWYYMPDIKDPIIQELLQSDDKIYEILNWILCRPQFFWRSRKTNERVITKL